MKISLTLKNISELAYMAASWGALGTGGALIDRSMREYSETAEQINKFFGYLSDKGITPENFDTDDSTIEVPADPKLPEALVDMINDCLTSKTAVHSSEDFYDAALKVHDSIKVTIQEVFGEEVAGRILDVPELPETTTTSIVTPDSSDWEF